MRILKKTPLKMIIIVCLINFESIFTSHFLSILHIMSCAGYFTAVFLQRDFKIIK